MTRWRLAIVAAVLLTTSVAGWRYMVTAGDGNPDRDGDGLDDRLESFLAVSHLPTIHEFVGEDLDDECLEPRRRPILYRARPRPAPAGVDLDSVAISYVLLYEEDCGPLGHAGDHEAFTIFLRRDRNPDRWRTVAGLAIAHQGTPAEQHSIGRGLKIWVSRNKHANFAIFDACGDSDIATDVCAETGPAPPGYDFLNVGEPAAPLSDDLGDLAAGSVDAHGGTPSIADEMESKRVYDAFRGQRIWHSEQFLEAGDLTAQFFVRTRVSVLPELVWEAESHNLFRKD